MLTFKEFKHTQQTDLVDWADKPLVGSILSLNENISLDLIKVIKKWDWEMMSMNPYVTFDIIKAYPKKRWDWTFLSSNPNMTFDIINTNDKPWDWNALIFNPNITIEIIEKHKDNLNIELLVAKLTLDS